MTNQSKQLVGERSCRSHPVCRAGSMIQVCAASGIHGDLPASTREKVSVCFMLLYCIGWTVGHCI